tara:strand:+ start:212 stop:703 length:492 start_codon:yes stop_codon:yes gene_type:complete
MSTPFKMKGMSFKSSPVLSDPSKDIADRDMGKLETESIKDKPKKKTLGQWFKSTKLGKDLKTAGETIQRDADKVKSRTSKVTNTIKDNISFDKKNVKEKIKSKKKSLETRKSNFDTKVKKDVGGLLNKLFIKKKKKTTPKKTYSPNNSNFGDAPQKKNRGPVA